MKGGPLLYLGTHKPHWLERTDLPLFISRRRLAERVRLPRARGVWALDSGGFTEISLHGKWVTSAKEYAAQVQRWQREIGGLQWAAVQDWMCEPFMLQKTGLSINEHQIRTAASYLALRDMAPEVPWCPVLQGWERDDYLRHVDLYERGGVDLRGLPIVGLGSVCRRQKTAVAELVVRELSSVGVRIHGFGFKATGVRRVADVLVSSDSMAWSYNARRNEPLHGCAHAKCSNCLVFAERWFARQRREVDAAAAQCDLFDRTAA